MTTHADLRRLAEAAIGGCCGYGNQCGGCDQCARYDEFRAAANPATILEMLKERDELVPKNRALRERLEKIEEAAMNLKERLERPHGGMSLEISERIMPLLAALAALSDEVKGEISK